MTSGNNGATTPEDDDPFGYLYADGQANGAQPPSGGYGYPNAVNRVRTVGQRQYGQQGPQPGAGYGQTPQQQGSYGQPNAHYAAPETLPGGAPTTQTSYSTGTGSGGRGRGPNTKGLLIGAIAVVAAVVIGIGVAMLGGDDDKDAKGDDTPATPTQSQTKDSGPSKTADPGDEVELPKSDAKTLALGGTAATASDVKGAQADGGVYVTGFNQAGSSVTWTVNGIPKGGKYTVYVGYSVPGKDGNATLTVNGTPSTAPVNLKNYAHAAEGDYEKGWTKTYNYIQLNKGTNTIKVSCEEGNQCDALLDQVWLVKGWVKS
ncbi:MULTISPECIES: CBM35 domain-containing protein [Streptomyces]|jgi:hypothetical protein|uniref:CBM35 domain-containing protein n=1 Tax=Streptomyces TaxID=1883 RepID=UPI0007480071|nr:MULTISPECIES: CBM35 domain-containing protein [Streptomyces]KUL72436.1 carbohydrate-binding protein [Streptomyces sp. NRRL WC-3605]KUL74741.1 carbohydrate-binding protein [Streptomyces sp. NRRL WC-3604]